MAATHDFRHARYVGLQVGVAGLPTQNSEGPVFERSASISPEVRKRSFGRPSFGRSRRVRRSAGLEMIRPVRAA